MGNRNFAAVLVAAVAVLIGCSKVPAVVQIPGWVETTSSGVSISLPADLKVTDLSKGDLKDIQSEAEKKFSEHPEVGKVVQQLAASGSMKLVARSDTKSSSEFQNSFSLVVQPVGSGATLVNLMDPNRLQMKAVSVPGSLTAEMRTYPAGQAGFFQFDLASGAKAHTQTTYIFLHDSKEFVFTFSSSTSDKNIWGTVAESAIKSVHFSE